MKDVQNESKPTESQVDKKDADVLLSTEELKNPEEIENKFITFFEQKVTKTKTQIKTYEEIITFGQYLKEQEDKGIISSEELKLLEFSLTQKP